MIVFLLIAHRIPILSFSGRCDGTSEGGVINLLQNLEPGKVSTSSRMHQQLTNFVFLGATQRHFVFQHAAGYKRWVFCAAQGECGQRRKEWIGCSIVYKIICVAYRFYQGNAQKMGMTMALRKGNRFLWWSLRRRSAVDDQCKRDPCCWYCGWSVSLSIQ